MRSISEKYIVLATNIIKDDLFRKKTHYTKEISSSATNDILASKNALYNQKDFVPKL